MAQAFFKPYRMGDTVRTQGDRCNHIILKVEISTEGKYFYSTNRGAWYDHEELIFVSECDEKSMKRLIKDIYKECKYV